LRIIKGIMGSGVSVDTVLSEQPLAPGGTLRGEVTFNGGDVDQKVESITLEFTALVEEDAKGAEHAATYHFFRAQVSGPFQLTAGTTHSVPFEVQTPWETPINTYNGRPLVGMKLGVSTELALDMAIDKGDLDPLTVEPLAAQTKALEALEALGFVLQEADLEAGTVSGSHMPFYQELEYWTGGEFSDKLPNLEMTFLTNASTTDVLLQTGNTGSLTAPGNDVYQRFTVPNDTTDDLTDQIRTQLEQLSQRRGVAG
jgi:sporulation-control protein